MTTLSVSYDGVRAVTRWEHKDSNPSTVVGFAYARDKVGNPDYELRLHQSNEGDEYKYDGLYRITGAVYDDAAAATPRVALHPPEQAHPHVARPYQRPVTMCVCLVIPELSLSRRATRSP